MPDPAAKVAEQLLVRPRGATMDEIIAVTGAPQYNILKKLQGRGFQIRKVKEQGATRYFAAPPEALGFEATLTSQGQVTVPKQVRERLQVRGGQKLRFTLTQDGRVELAAASHSITDLFGILGKPPKSATLAEMDEGIRRSVVERYLRSVE